MCFGLIIVCAELQIYCDVHVNQRTKILLDAFIDTVNRWVGQVDDQMPLVWLIVLCNNAKRAGMSCGYDSFLKMGQPLDYG